MSATVTEIFDHYAIPSILRTHIIRAAAVGDYIVKNWKGPILHEERILSALLLHDIGKPVGLLDTDLVQKRGGRSKTRAIRERFVKKYGSDEHIAAFNVAHELGVDAEVCRLIRNTGVLNNEMIVESKDWDLKICAYADQRVSPYGVVSLRERFADFKKRYKGTTMNIWNLDSADFIVKAAHKLENQVIEKTSITPQQITNECVKDKMASLLSFQIKRHEYEHTKRKVLVDRFWRALKEKIQWIRLVSGIDLLGTHTQMGSSPTFQNPFYHELPLQIARA